MRISSKWVDRLTDWFADYLSRPIEGFEPPAAYSADQLGAVLQPLIQPGDRSGLRPCGNGAMQHGRLHPMPMRLMVPAE